MPHRKYVLDTNCFIDAARDIAAREAFTAFCTAAAPRLYLSVVVAAELRAGARTGRERRGLDEMVLGPYMRRGRVLAPSAESWHALGSALIRLRDDEGLEPRQVPKSFVFDVLVAHSCREAGAVLISRNARDMERIARAFGFECVAPYPVLTNDRM